MFVREYALRLGVVLLSVIVLGVGWIVAGPAPPGAGRAVTLGPLGAHLPSPTAAGAWTQMGTRLPGVESAGLAYDSAADRVIQFGGVNITPSQTFLNQTAAYDPGSNTWTNLTPRTAPAARAWAGMVYDSRADRVILFGGANTSSSTPALYNDTWAFDYPNDTWTPLLPANAPTPRCFFGMTYDVAADRVLLFGGYTTNGSKLLGDTWSYDYKTNSWSELLAVGPVSPRAAISMEYAAVMNEAYLFGGVRLSGMEFAYDRELWAFDYTNVTWRLKTATTGPSVRGAYGLTYDAYAERLLLFGGLSGDQSILASYPVNDTWSYDPRGGGWTNLSPAIHPSARFDAAMTYDSTRNESVLFGGRTEFYQTAEVWTYQFPQTPSAPRNLAANPGLGLLTLTWLAPVSPGGAAVSGYKIYRGTASGTETLLTSVGNVLTYADHVVTQGTTYYYRVSAVSTIGEGPNSNEVSATPIADTEAPALAFASPANGSLVSSGSVTVQGTASDDVAVQRVELSTDGSTWAAASGTAYWSGIVTLREGANTIYARAYDTAGNRFTAWITVTVQQPSTLDALLLPLTGLAVVIVIAVAVLVLYLRRRKQKPGTPAGPPPPPP